MSYCYPRNKSCPFNLPEVENWFLEGSISSLIAWDKCCLLRNSLMFEGFYKEKKNTDAKTPRSLSWYSIRGIGIKAWLCSQEPDTSKAFSESWTGWTPNSESQGFLCFALQYSPMFSLWFHFGIWPPFLFHEACFHPGFWFSLLDLASISWP